MGGAAVANYVSILERISSNGVAPAKAAAYVPEWQLWVPAFAGTTGTHSAASSARLSFPRPGTAARQLGEGAAPRRPVRRRCRSRSIRPCSNTRMRVALRTVDEPVRDHEGGAVLHHLVERGLHLGLGGGVERAGRLVEDQDRRVLQQRARDRQPLALAAGQQAAALADRSPSRPSGLRSMKSSACARSAASRISSSVASGLPTRRFSRDRAVEQQHLLEHHADVAAQRRELDARGCPCRRS